MVSSKNHAQWHKDALKQIVGSPRVSQYPVHVTLLFYVVDDRKRDIDNMVASVMDLLQDKDVIESDAWQAVRSIEASVVAIDRIDPRVEIDIEPMPV